MNMFDEAVQVAEEMVKYRREVPIQILPSDLEKMLIADIRKKFQHVDTRKQMLSMMIREIQFMELQKGNEFSVEDAYAQLGNEFLSMAY